MLRLFGAIIWLFTHNLIVSIRADLFGDLSKHAAHNVHARQQFSYLQIYYFNPRGFYPGSPPNKPPITGLSDICMLT